MSYSWKMGALALERLPPWVRDLLIFSLFVMMTVVMTWPWARHLRDTVSDNGDSYAFVWSLWWNYHQTFTDPLNLFHANIFFPYRYTLAYTEHGYGAALLFFPLLALGLPPMTVYSVAILLAFAFCGYASFRLTRTLTGSFPISLVAGIIFAFIPYRLLFITALPYLLCAWVPLSLEALILFARRRSWKRAAWLGLCLLMSGMTNITWFFYSLVPLVPTFIFLVIRYDIHKDRALWLRGVIALVISALLLFPFLWPYYKASTLYSYKKDITEVEQNSVRTEEWLTAPVYNRFWGYMGMGSGLPGIRVTLFTGLLPLLLFLAGIFLVEPYVLIANNDQRRARGPINYSHRLLILDLFCLLAFVIAIVAAGYAGAPGLSRFAARFLNAKTSDRAVFVLIGLLLVRFCISYPAILQFGRNRNLIETFRSQRRSDAFWISTIWVVFSLLLTFGVNTFFYRVLYDLLLPFKSLRAPHRAAMIGYVGFAILAGLGAGRVANLIPRKRFVNASLTFAIIGVVILVELHAAPLPVYRGVVDADEVSLKLKQTAMRGAVLDLPSLPGPPYYSWHLSMLRSVHHGHPVIFASSSFIPPLPNQIHQLVTQATLSPDLLTLLEEVPTSYIVLHRKLIEPDRQPEFTRFFNEAVSTGRLRLIGTYGDGDDLYAITKTEPEAR
ncbi:MAG TPA: hypothetical protein VLA93_14220 [Pyrinomonadaceae bacterium]|nr:hypothetical protein [Pyrinomonadaceae bacterium]